MHFSIGRRSALKRAGAAGLWLLAPGCGKNEPVVDPKPAAGDFADGALRLDLRQRLAEGAEDFTLERVRFERTWPGRRDRLADGPGWGDYRLSVYLQDREAPLFRHGFDTSLAPHARSATAQVERALPHAAAAGPGNDREAARRVRVPGGLHLRDRTPPATPSTARRAR
jgi:hypothetical protein